MVPLFVLRGDRVWLLNPNVFSLQALEVIRELQKHFPIKRSPMRLRLTVPGQAFSSVSEKLNEWKSSIVSKEESGNQLSVVRFLFFIFRVVVFILFFAK